MGPFERAGAVTAYSYATDPRKGEHFLPFTSWRKLCEQLKTMQNDHNDSNDYCNKPETLSLSLRLNNNILCNQVPHFQINVGQGVGETGVWRNNNN